MRGHPASDADLLSTYCSSIDGMRDGEAAFAELVSRHGGMVYHTCLRVLGNRTAAEDAAQATFVVLARKAKGVRGNVEGFLHGVAVNVAKRARDAERRRRQRERDAVMESRQREAGMDAVTWDEIRTHLDEAIERLPRMQRTVTVMCLLEGRKQTDAAGALGISRTSVEVHLRRAQDRLRAALSRHSKGLSAAVLAGLLAERAAEAACPAFLSASTRDLVATQLSAGALSTNAGVLAKGVIRMMFWAKVKTAAAVLTVISVAGMGTAVAMSDAPKTQPKPVPPPETKGKGLSAQEPKATETGNLVNGVLFEPILRSPVWVITEDGRPADVQPALRVTNKSKENIHLNHYGLKFRMVDAGGNTLRPYPAYYALKRGKYRPNIKDFLLLKPGQTQLLASKPNSVWPEWGALRVRKSIKNKRGQESYYGAGNFRFFAIKDPGKYQLTITYNSFGTLPGVPTWDGRYQSKPVPLRVCRGWRGDLATVGLKEATQTFGRDGLLVVRSEHRLRTLMKELRERKVRTVPGPVFQGVDFAKEVIVWRTMVGNSDSMLSLSGYKREGNQVTLAFEDRHPGIADHNVMVWKFLAVALPKAEGFKLGHRIVDSKGGDVVDNLQGCLEAKKNRIKPGEDIRVTFTLKAANAKAKEPVYVWDTKYSGGYNADIYMVQMPDGKVVEMKRNDHGDGGMWDKNVPHIVAITPGKPYVTPDWWGKIKSLKQRGLDTTQPGVYRVWAVYRQKGGEPAKGAGFRRLLKPGNSLWGGNITSNTIEVVVARE